MKFKTVTMNIFLGWNNRGKPLLNFLVYLFSTLLSDHYLAYQIMKMIVMLIILQDAKKVHPRHRILSPGMITIACRHGINYVFKILTSAESTVIVFNILICHFRHQPKYIIYDNACNLHNTCLIR